MTDGKIIITFKEGEPYVIALRTCGDRRELRDMSVWKELKKWWVTSQQDAFCVTCVDGSEVLLLRSTILNISLTPVAGPLEIK